MIKKNCVKCGDKIPGTRSYNEVYGNWCTPCSGKTGTHYTKRIKESLNKTPLETEAVRRYRLKLEARLAEQHDKELRQLSDAEYSYLKKKVAEETRMLEIEKAHAQYSDLEIV